MKFEQIGFDRLTSAKATNLLGFFLVIWPILIVYLFQYSCQYKSCSILSSLGSWREFCCKYVEIFLNPFKIQIKTVKYLFCWYAFQALLFLIVPGPLHDGRAMTSGRILKYKINGLICFIISGMCCILLAYWKIIDPLYYVDNITEFLKLSNVCGLALSFFAYFKGKIFPNNKEECYLSGSFLYDFYTGVEHSPRFGYFDFKQFFNARPGIALWPLINLCYAAKMYNTYGFITNSMIIVNFLQFLYVFDLFLFEAWYIRTIDIAYDHFGFYLAWGDLVFLPYMYTFQGYYLTFNPVSLSYPYATFITIVGFLSVVLFRRSNNQKEKFRQAIQHDKPYMIFGKPAQYITARYHSSDKRPHISFLLADGFWGFSRHFNYLTDMVNALMYCLPCGFSHILPYFYFIFMVILLLHRIERDHMRCQDKYGEKWDLYCQKVPYKLIPYIY